MKIDRKTKFMSIVFLALTLALSCSLPNLPASQDSSFAGDVSSVSRNLEEADVSTTWTSSAQLIDVPYHKQEQSKWCSNAVIQMAIDQISDQVPTQTELAGPTLLNNAPNNKVGLYTVLNVLNTKVKRPIAWKQYSASNFGTNETTNATTLKNLIQTNVLSRGTPVILLLSPFKDLNNTMKGWKSEANTNTIRHYIIVYGYDFTNGRNLVFYHDPYNKLLADNEPINSTKYTDGKEWSTTIDVLIKHLKYYPGESAVLY